jgi:hypothetical protein
MFTLLVVSGVTNNKEISGGCRRSSIANLPHALTPLWVRSNDGDLCFRIMREINARSRIAAIDANADADI